MVGGDDEHVEQAACRSSTRSGPRASGFVHAGEVGAGHYAKMVHNGIEYGLMQAYAEGYELLEDSDIVDDVPGVFKAWRQGTVVRSWLLDLLVRALEEDPTSTSCAATPTTPARAAGPSRRPSASPCRCRSSRRRCSPGSPRARRTRRR